MVSVGQSGTILDPFCGCGTTIDAAVDETFKKAPESKKKLGHQKDLGL